MPSRRGWNACSWGRWRRSLPQIQAVEAVSAGKSRSHRLVWVSLGSLALTRAVTALTRELTHRTFCRGLRDIRKGFSGRGSTIPKASRGPAGLRYWKFGNLSHVPGLDSARCCEPKSTECDGQPGLPISAPSEHEREGLCYVCTSLSGECRCGGSPKLLVCHARG
ncbi:uncharacterized protein BDZ99DRAFT_300982 [Mytilinidion resinicola]|uniref:Uncharacterized protein n=1 Tax=Mytilinidion resinicola TaxID=574789 RepID=A0A6A6YML6_9PEZI|nr:uncharacterized protein BDZ99DRAFT_300982 [Mytilinidion resinicola]KAF2809981.1 hypothetical protein BDZ99DRAFT_300982 [Mytilinidion resinicola]